MAIWLEGLRDGELAVWDLVGMGASPIDEPLTFPALDWDGRLVCLMSSATVAVAQVVLNAQELRTCKYERGSYLELRWFLVPTDAVRRCVMPALRDLV